MSKLKDGLIFNIIKNYKFIIITFCFLIAKITNNT